MAHVWTSRTIDAAELADLYEWLDRVPLSRARVQVEKDFADGALAAEVVKYYFPDLVDLKEYQLYQNVQDRVAQWKTLNQRVFRRIGLNVPSHVITQLSIAKSGTAQILLYNLRTCITLSGANTSTKPMTVIAEPMIATTSYVVRPNYDPGMWYKYNMRHNLLKRPIPIGFQDEFEYYRQKKQAERVLKSAKTRQLGNSVVPKSFSHPNIQNQNVAILPPLVNPYVSVEPAASRIGLAAAKLELDDKTQKITEREDEIQFLKGQLKRMEILLASKNAKIQELQLQVEKQNRPQKKT